jgi:hypothetical protein
MGTLCGKRELWREREIELQTEGGEIGTSAMVVLV